MREMQFKPKYSIPWHIPIVQVFFVDDIADPEWKVVLEKQPRSRRHSEEDDDIYRPYAGEHIFDAPGLTNPLTGKGRQTRDLSTSWRVNSQIFGLETSSARNYVGEQVPVAEV